MNALGSLEKVTKDATLLREPRMKGLREKLIRTSLEFYRELQSSLEGDVSTEARAQLSEAYASAAHLTWELGSQEEALAVYRRSLALVEQIAAVSPSDPTIRAQLARSYFRIGFSLRTMGRPSDALSSFEHARTIQGRLVSDHPDNARHQERLSWTLSNIGVMYVELGRPFEAIEPHTWAIAIHEDLVRRFAGITQYQNDLGWAWRYLSMALAAGGDLDSALRMAERAAAIFEDLVISHPGNPEICWRLGRCLDEVGRIRSELGRPLDAAGPLDSALEFHASLSHDDPAFYGVDLARNRLYAALQRTMSGRTEDVVILLRKVNEVLRESGQVSPQVMLHDLACSYLLWSAAGREGAIGLADREQRTRRAITALRRAIAAGRLDLVQVRNNPVLDSLRTHREFLEMITDLSSPADPFRP